MYKRLSYPELLGLKTRFFDNLNYVLSIKKHKSLRDYLLVTHKQWTESYHMMKQECIWRTILVQWTDHVVFFDEREKIELQADKAILAKIQNLIGDTRKLANQKRTSQSIEETLQQVFESWQFSTINDKPYLVYDIETSYMTNDMKAIEFYLWYAYIVEHGKWTYKYLDADNMHKFVDFMLDFDGYVIGFNSLAFDNPVSLYHILRNSYSQAEFDTKLIQLNDKSLDIFQFVWNLTGKRMGLNRLSRALIGIGKTLESGKEGEWLWKAYQEWDEKSLKILKEYCKNDVKMTYLLLWYILYYGKLSLEGEDFSYNLEEFLQFSNTELHEEDIFASKMGKWGSLF